MGTGFRARQAAILKAGKAEELAVLSGLRAFPRPLALAGAGALIGFAHDPGSSQSVFAGAALGAAAGSAIHWGPEAVRFARSPAGKATGILTIPLAAAALGLAFRGHEYGGAAVLREGPDGDVRYLDSPMAEESLRSRMESMEASGDLVFGLNSGRHG